MLEWMNKWTFECTVEWIIKMNEWLKGIMKKWMVE